MKYRILSFLILLVPVGYGIFLYNSLTKTETIVLSAAERPSVPSEFSFTAQLTNGSDMGNIEVATFGNMMRIEYVGDKIQTLAIHRDGYTYNLKPIKKLSLQNQNAFDWRFSSISRWKYLRTETYKARKVDLYSHKFVKDGHIYKNTYFYDPALKFPVKCLFENGGGWELIAMGNMTPPYALFQPPQELVDAILKPPYRACKLSENTECSKGWICGEPCPGGICC